MKFVTSFLVTCALLSFALIWQAGCNPDAGISDPLRPQADVQVLGFSPAVLSPTQVQTGGVHQTTTTVGGVTTITTAPNTAITFPTPVVNFRINNGVGALVTGYSVVYTYQNAATPNTGLAVFGGPLNQFIDAAQPISELGTANGNGPAGNGGTPATAAPATGSPGFGSGLASFPIVVVSPEAATLIGLSSNVVVANITFFVQDINGHTFTLPAKLTLSSQVLIGGGTTGATGTGGQTGGATTP